MKIVKSWKSQKLFNHENLFGINIHKFTFTSLRTEVCIHIQVFYKVEKCLHEWLPLLTLKLQQTNWMTLTETGWDMTNSEDPKHNKYQDVTDVRLDYDVWII